MKHVRIPNQYGFSVVEITIALAIFLIFSSAAITVVLQGFDLNRTSTESIVANQYAIEGIEAVRSIRNQSYTYLVATASAGITRSASNTWTFFGTNNYFGPNNKYTRVITLSPVSRDASGNIVSNGGTIDPNTMKATVTVTWNHTPTRIDNVTQTTYLTNWRSWTIAQDTFVRANTTCPTGWGAASDGQTWGQDGQNCTFFSINNNTGQINKTNGITYNAIIGQPATNAEVLFSGYFTGSCQFSNFGAIIGWQDTNNWYKAFIGNNDISQPTNCTTINLQKRYAGTYYDLQIVNFTAVPNTNYSFRFRYVNGAFYVRAWPTGSTEPSVWNINGATDTSGTPGWVSGNVGLRAVENDTGNLGSTINYTSFLATGL